MYQDDEAQRGFKMNGSIQYNRDTHRWELSVIDGGHGIAEGWHDVTVLVIPNINADHGTTTLKG